MSSTSNSRKETRKNAPGIRSDIGWEYGIDVDNNSKKVRCKFYEKVFSGGIYRFKNHLACTHKDVKPCKQVPNDVRQKMLGMLVKNIEISEKKRKIIHDIGDDSLDLEVQSQRGKDVMDYFSRKGSSGTKSTQSTINQMMKKDLREEYC